jgi:serine/threonine protein kinase
MIEGLPDDAKEFIEALLQKDPTKRPRITQLFDFSLFRHLSPSKQKKTPLK